jgi:hypothetical protein
VVCFESAGCEIEVLEGKKWLVVLAQEAEKRS